MENFNADKQLEYFPEKKFKDKKYWKTELNKRTDDLIFNIQEKNNLSDKDEGYIRATAKLVMDAHQKQIRKDGSTPYFAHQLKVTKTLIEKFNVTDAKTIQVSLLHDTREDQDMEYQDIKDIFQYTVELIESCDELAGKDEQQRIDLIKLGIRLLSKLEGPKYKEPLKDMSSVDKKAELNREYFKRLSNPKDYYNKEKIDNKKYAEYDDKFIRNIQLIKLSDRITNIGDLKNLITNQPTEKALKLPAKTFKKTIDSFIPDFVEKSKYLTDQDKKIFYTSIIKSLQEYSQIEDPKGEFIKKAAIEALDSDILQ